MTQQDYLFTTDHEWIKIEDNKALIGITEHAVKELGEIVYVELPDLDSEFNQTDEFGSIESVKTVSSIYTPINGKVTKINEELQDHPEIINESPYTDGWLVELEHDENSDLSNLMNHEDYQEYLLTAVS